MSAALAEYETVIGSQLLRVELRRLGLRRGELALADRLLEDIALVPLDRDVLTAAETILPTRVTTLDALLLATALRLAGAGMLDAVMTYDARLAEGARHHGLAIVAPG